LLAAVVVVLEVPLPELEEVVVGHRRFLNQIKVHSCPLLMNLHMSGLVQDRALLIQVLGQEMPEQTLDLAAVDQEMDILLQHNMPVMVDLDSFLSHIHPKYLKKLYGTTSFTRKRTFFIQGLLCKNWN
jgi:hypothetical protein